MNRFRRARPAVTQALKLAGPYLLIALAVALLFWPVWLLNYTYPVGGGDLWAQLLPVWSYVGRFLRRGVLALWATNMMAGDPIVSEPQYGLFNPLNMGVFAALALGLKSQSVVLIRGLLPLALAGAGLFTYLRHSPVWRLQTGAALVGALAYMASDPFITHLGHPQINDAMAWLPWCLLAVDVTLQQRRLRPWAVGVIAATVLAGHYQTAMFAGAATAVYALWRLLAQAPRTWLRHAARLGLLGACALALTLPTVLASLERYPFTERAILQLEPWRGYQWPLSMSVDLLIPGWHGRGTQGFWGPWARVEGGYAGAAALFLALLGILTNVRKGRGWFFLGLGAFGVLYALGYDGPIYAWFARIDLVARIHKTARSIYLLSFVIAIFAAAGAQALRERRWQCLTLWSVLVASILLMLMVRAPAWMDAVPASRRAAAWEGLWVTGVVGVVVVGLGWALGQRSRGRPFATSALILLLLSELCVTTVGVDLEQTLHNPAQPAIDYIESDPSWYRVDVDAEARGLQSPSALLSYGFEVPQGSGNPMEFFSFTQFYWAIPTKGAPAYQLLGAKYLIVPKDALPGGEGIWPVFQDAPLVDVHLNTNALPRVWLIYHTLPVETIEEANAIVFDPAFRPAEIAAVENGPQLAEQGSGTLEVVAYGANRADIVVRTTERAMLVLSDLHYPGWVATVDGEWAPIYKTDGIFRGVVVPPGEHIIRMRYRPVSFRVGAGAAGSTLLILGYAVVRPSLKRRIWYNGGCDGVVDTC